MKCREVNEILTENQLINQNSQEWRSIEDHLQNCSRCASLKDDLESIRQAIADLPRHALSEELEAKTYQLCRNEQAKMERKAKEKKSAPPPIIWILFTALVILTAYITIPLFKNLQSEEPFSAQTIFILAIIIQNAVMLFFSPFLFKKFTHRQRLFRTENHV